MRVWQTRMSGDILLGYQVANTAREWIENTKEPSLLREADNISSKTVYEAAIRGDKMAVRIFEYTGEVLGRSLANFVAFSAPEAIVLFGGLTKAREFFYEPLVKTMNDNMMPIWRGKVRVCFLSLRNRMPPYLRPPLSRGICRMF